MSATNAFETSLLSLIFTNTNIASIGDATGLRGSSAAGSFYIALHTADPTDAAASQAVSEATYTGYARVAVSRDTGSWTVTNNQAVNDSAITFPQCTGGSNTITHWSVGVAASGATGIILKGALSASLAVSNGIIPYIAAGNMTVTLD